MSTVRVFQKHSQIFQVQLKKYILAVGVQFSSLNSWIAKFSKVRESPIANPLEETTSSEGLISKGEWHWGGHPWILVISRQATRRQICPKSRPKEAYSFIESWTDSTWKAFIQRATGVYITAMNACAIYDICLYNALHICIYIYYIYIYNIFVQ